MTGPFRPLDGKGPSAKPILPQEKAPADDVSRLAQQLLKKDELTAEDLTDDLMIRAHLSVVAQTRRLGARMQAIRGLEEIRSRKARQQKPAGKDEGEPLDPFEGDLD